MKRVFAILFSVIILLSGAHLSYATHYCGGKIVATKFSFTQALASCGMTADKHKNSTAETQIAKNCCFNEIFNLKVATNYCDSDNDLKVVPHSFLLAFYALPKDCNQLINLTNKLSNDVKPPNIRPTYDVSLPDICVFRI